MRGIYKITCLSNLKCYIGKSNYIEKRFKEHTQKLLNNKHINKKLQHDFNKYGINNFEFKVLIETTTDNLNYYESLYAEKFLAFDCGYNIGFLHKSKDIKFIQDNFYKLEEDFINKIINPLEHIIKEEKHGIEVSINTLIKVLKISKLQFKILISKLYIKNYIFSFESYGGDNFFIKYHDLDKLIDNLDYQFFR